ncbi:Retrotransposon Tca5 Polyprotein, partial [Phytophthora megakarya]
MEVRRNREKRTMAISQHNYVNDLLKKFKMEGCASVATPQLRGVEREAETGIRRLRLSRASEITAVSGKRNTTRHCECSEGIEQTHWVAARRLLKYLKVTSTYGLLLDGNSRTVTYEVYTDASFACQTKERKSVTGYGISIAGSSVSWYSSKQGSISLSTAEAELIALSEDAKESEWIWYLLREMGVLRKNRKAAINTVMNPGNHKATKHIEIRFLFTGALVEEGRLEIQHCYPSDMAADILTKALPPGQFIKLRNRSGSRTLRLLETLSGSVRPGTWVSTMGMPPFGGDRWTIPGWAG